MGEYRPEDIRNIVLCGHAHTGKTMLAEAMLLKAGAVNRLGSVADGSTTSDFEPDEKERGCSLNSAVMHCTFDKKQFHIIDTPGSTPFIGQMVQGIAGADLAVICVNATKGIELNTRKAWKIAEEEGVARMLVVTRMDADDANFAEVLADLKKTFGKQCLCFTLNDGEGAGFSGVRRVMDEAVTDGASVAKRLEITELAVECDDELMMRYLDGETISHDEVLGVLREAICGGNVVPVFCLAAEKDIGVAELMHGIADWGPDPFHTHRTILLNGEEQEWKPEADAPFAAQVFKIVSDPHVGKISFLRVFSGRLAAKEQPIVSSTGKKEKFSQLMICQGGKHEDLAEAVAGDIVAVPKVEALHIGDTVHAEAFKGLFKTFPFPNPMAGLAVEPKKRGDEQKLAQNLGRLCDEDPTFRFERNDLTGEQVIRGIGQLHLDTMLGRLKRRYNLEVETHVPKIPYLETISMAGEGMYRHKKQSGGAGQFAEVHIRIKPNERGAGFEFVNSIVGGVISGPFIPSVEKGVRKALQHGPTAGFPVMDVIVELFDGKEHPVDSKDIAFQIAGEVAFKEIIQKCKPVLLEPIVNMEIIFPQECTGDISGDISTRRGRPTGMEQMGALQMLSAQVPLAEVANYGSTLSAITGGEGDYTMELSHYEPLPGNIAQQVAAKLKQEEEARHG